MTLIADKIIDKLPDFYNMDENSNLKKLYNVVFSEFDDIQKVIIDIQNNIDVDKAFYSGLDQIGDNTNVARLGLDDENYRNAIKTKSGVNTSNATVNFMLETIIAQIPEVESYRNIILLELSNAHIMLYFRRVNLSDMIEKYSSLINAIKPVGVHIDWGYVGTLETAELSYTKFDPEKGLGSIYDPEIGGTLGSIYDTEIGTLETASLWVPEFDDDTGLGSIYDPEIGGTLSSFIYS